MSTATVTPGADIRQRRERMGVSRLSLAAHAGCSVTYLQTIEGGVTPTRGVVLSAITAALDELERQNEIEPEAGTASGSMKTTTAGVDSDHGPV